MHTNRLRRASFLLLIAACVLLLATSALTSLLPNLTILHGLLAPLTILAALSLASWLYFGKRVREEEESGPQLPKS